MQSNTSVTVGATSTLVAAARYRRSLVFTNDSDEVIYLSFGAAAVMNKGVRLNASGGSHTKKSWNGEVYAICASGSKNLCVCETA